jgi:DNA-binding CsgD family transcriptional regulator
MADDRLTPRQRDVLVALWEEDGDMAAVAARLRISPHTARTHVDRAQARLGVSTRIAAIRRAVA